MRRIDHPGRLWLVGGWVRDPIRGTDGPLDLVLEGGRIVALEPPGQRPPEGAATLDVRGRWLVPSFWDLHAHLREPGGEASETVASGQAAALKGGFTAVTAMPNTSPANDAPEVTRRIRAAAAASGLPVAVWPVGAITVGLRGEALSDFAALADAGARAFSDDGRPVMDPVRLENACRRLAALGRPALLHCEDRARSRGGVMHLGAVSAALGLPGIDRACEDRMVERDLALASRTGVRVHICHVSTRGAAAALRRARARGWDASGEATPHHLVLTDEAVREHGANAKMNPPLREADDVEALIEALNDRTLEVVATDHAPHRARREAMGMAAAPFGIIGLESTWPVLYTGLVESGRVDAYRLLEALTVGPAGVLGLARPGIRPGADADLVVLENQTSWTFGPEHLRSKSRNSPFLGREVRGRVECVCQGVSLHVAPDAGLSLPATGPMSG